MAEEMNQGAFECEVTSLVGSVRAPEGEWEARAWMRLDSLTKPPRSLGRLEELAVHVAVAQGTDRPEASPSAIVLAAGDHGVVAEGVTPWPSEVTTAMVANFVTGGAAINQIAGQVGARLVLLDVGVKGDTSAMEGVLQRTVRTGTRNLAVEAAMSREEACQALMAGAEVAMALADEGVRVIATGEMGIGNSTPAAALVAAYTGVPVDRVVGRGTGADDAMLQRKKDVIERALKLHAPRRDDPLGTLSALGGLEIAAMAGVVIGAAVSRVPVVCDGLISTAAALAAVAVCPQCVRYLIASHLSAEPGHHVALVALELEPFLHLGMRLGEGTGAALALGVLGSACAVMNGMATFDEAGIAESHA